jgi:aspartyl-tRNA(Asn)/glutamyl-tRNA(Gln) amidotransferase subunit A
LLKDGTLDFIALDYTHLKQQLLSRNISCVEITQTYLDKITAAKDINAFISVRAEKALEQAKTVDQKIALGSAGKLAGMVVAVKDLLNVKGEITSCASRILSNFRSPYDATVIAKIKAEDAIIVGKTNMDQFGMGSSNENSAFGPVRNPLNKEYVPGGSSGGSAAAVAGNLCSAALGTDTGGSIRQPAAFCGVVGLKPTYGRVSRFGLVAYASSLDQIGPITKSVPDAAFLLQTIAGHDSRDSTSAPLDVPLYDQLLDQKDVKGVRIGIPKEYFADGLDADSRKAIMNAVDGLHQAGAEIIDVSLPHTEYAVAAYYIIATAEASSNLARYDGARYGVRAASATDLQSMYVQSRTNGLSDEVKRRIMLGTYVLSSGYYEAYYRKAQKVRTFIKNDFEKAFQKVDCLVTPTSPTTAFKLGEKLDDPLKMYLSDIYTVSVNLAGLPAISIPCGIDSRSLPIGMQIIGKPFDESFILGIARFVESCRGDK